MLTTLYHKLLNMGLKPSFFSGFGLFLRFLVVHLVVYLAVNGLLLFVNLYYSPELLWVLFPVAGWGAGVVMHLVLTLLWFPRPAEVEPPVENNVPEDAAPDNCQQIDTV